MALKEIVWQPWEFDLIDLHVHTNQQHIWHKISHWSRPINSNLILTICIRKANNMAQNIVENCIRIGGCWWIDGWFMCVDNWNEDIGCIKTTRSTWIPSATSSDSPESIHQSIHSFFDLEQINTSSKYWTSVTRCWGLRCFLRMARPLIDRQCADKNIHGQCYTSGGHHNRASVLFAPINSSREKCQSFEMILTEIL